MCLYSRIPVAHVDTSFTTQMAQCIPLGIMNQRAALQNFSILPRITDRLSLQLVDRIA
jgi:hypothetical protein